MDVLNRTKSQAKRRRKPGLTNLYVDISTGLRKKLDLLSQAEGQKLRTFVERTLIKGLKAK